MRSREFQITLTIDGSTYNLHDYGGVDLIRNVTKDVRLHKSLKPVQDKASISLTYSQTLASLLLGIDRSTDCLVEINRQETEFGSTLGGGDADDTFSVALGGGGAVGSFSDILGGGGAQEFYAWFTGYLRPLTEVSIDEEDNIIEIEAVDTTELFKTSFSSNITWDDYKICDTTTTASSIVHQICDLVGADTSKLTDIDKYLSYVSGDLEDGTPVYSYAPFKADEGDDIYKELSALLLSYGYSFYADETGAIVLYDLSPASITPDYTVNESLMIGNLDVKRKIEEHDGIELTYRDVLTIDDHQVWSTDYLGKFGYQEENNQISSERSIRFDESLTGTLNLSDRQDKILAIDNTTVSAFFKKSPLGRFRWFVRDEAVPYGPDPSDSRGLYDFDADEHGVTWRYQCASWPGREVVIRDVHLKADITYTSKTDPIQYPTTTTPVDPEKIDAEYIFCEDDANALASLHYQRLIDSLYTYSFKSERLISIGSYVTLANTTLNQSVTVRIIGIKATSAIWPIYEYEAESVAATTPIISGIAAGTFSASSRIAAPPAGLASTGDVLNAIQGNLLTPSFEPSETGLFFSPTYLGFWDNELEEWVARIQNDDGTGKAHFGGSSDKYLDWDGTDLTIKGAASISGTLDVGDTLTVDGDIVLSGGEITGTEFTLSDTGLSLTAGTIDIGDGVFAVAADGSLTATSATITGAITATSGSFTGTITAETGEIGGWDITSASIESDDETVKLRSDEKRLEVLDGSANVKVALGYLDGIGSYTGPDFGLYVADGNVVDIEGDAEYGNGDWAINSDGAFVVRDAEGIERARLGSLGAGDVGIDIGGVTFGATLGGGDADDTFGDILGGGGATGTFGSTLGGGDAEFGPQGLRYSIADGTLQVRGDIYADNGYFAGELRAASGTFAGALSAATGSLGELDVEDIITIAAGGAIQSSNYVADTSGWRIDDTGVEIDDGTFRGTLSAVDGTLGDLEFSGIIDSAYIDSAYTENNKGLRIFRDGHIHGSAIFSTKDGVDGASVGDEYIGFYPVIEPRGYIPYLWVGEIGMAASDSLHDPTLTYDKYIPTGMVLRQAMRSTADDSITGVFDGSASNGSTATDAIDDKVPLFFNTSLIPHTGTISSTTQQIIGQPTRRWKELHANAKSVGIAIKGDSNVIAYVQDDDGTLFTFGASASGTSGAAWHEVMDEIVDAELLQYDRWYLISGGITNLDPVAMVHITSTETTFRGKNTESNNMELVFDSSSTGSYVGWIAM